MNKATNNWYKFCNYVQCYSVYLWIEELHFKLGLKRTLEHEPYSYTDFMVASMLECYFEMECFSHSMPHACITLNNYEFKWNQLPSYETICQLHANWCFGGNNSSSPGQNGRHFAELIDTRCFDTKMTWKKTVLYNACVFVLMLTLHILLTFQVCLWTAVHYFIWRQLHVWFDPCVHWIMEQYAFI